MTELELKSNNFKMISTYFNEINDYYWINDIGQIYSTNTNKFLAPYTDRDGYYRQALTLKRVDKTTPKIRLIGVHQLVNTIFNGRASKSVYQPVTDHIDGDRTNNYYKNLRWLSSRANASFAYRHLGKKTNISDDDVLIIYRKYREGCKDIYKLAEEYGTTYKYMHGILSGRKRRTVCDLYLVEPPLISKPEEKLDVFDVWEICFILLSDPSVSSVTKKMGLQSSGKVKHIKQKHSWLDYTEDFDFINQTTTIFDDSEDIFVTNDLMTIGETEYFIPDNWDNN